MQIVLFLIYAWLEHLCWACCDLLPPFARMLVFRAAFKHFGNGAVIDYGSYIRYRWKVSIGASTMLNRGCRIYASHRINSAEIIIGKRVAIGPDVKIYSAGHDYVTLDLVDTAATIRIADHAWIGAGAIILQGVEIGEGAVVGAGSLVTRSVPPWSVAVGNPARVIKSRVII